MQRPTPVWLALCSGGMLEDNSLLTGKGLAPNDTAGRPLHYQARLDREGRHLHGAETVGDALREDDEIVLTPNIDAG